MTRRQTMAVVVGLVFLATVSSFSQESAHPLQFSATRDAYRPEVPGVHGLVTAGHPLASVAGLRVLMEGGNAIDASVAILATLNVVRPQMSGAGGNGFLTYFHQSSGTVHSLSATGAAPKALDADELTPDELNKGIKAGVVPGLFGGWIAALERFGTMSLAEVLAPAIDYAENGHPIEKSVVRSIGSSQELFSKFPTSERVFLPEGRVPQTGERFRMPDLANTLKKVVEAEQNALRDGKPRAEALRAAFERFYEGDIAEEMAHFYQENDGLFTLEDFAEYEPGWTEPVHTSYRGYDVYSSPPTSRGGLEVLMQLNLIEGFDVSSLGHNSPETLHLIAESIKLAKSDVYQYVADPRRFDVPVAGMLMKEYAARRRELIDTERAMTYPSPGKPIGAVTSDAASLAGAGSERSYPGSTTSFSVVDRRGNVVACTPTHGGMFGTGVVVGNTGLTFNNGTRIGSTSPYPDHVNYARGGQIPILNNSPILVLKDGKFVMALGTPGGETIGQTQFQVLLNVLDFGMPIQEAVEAPRVSLFAEPNFYKTGANVVIRAESRIPPKVLEALGAKAHKVEATSGYALGSVQAILRNLETGTMAAAADPRRVAYAVGW